jgi:hypothetical protein
MRMSYKQNAYTVEETRSSITRRISLGRDFALCLQQANDPTAVQNSCSRRGRSNRKTANPKLEFKCASSMY